MRDWINEKYLNTTLLRSAYHQKPFAHIALRNFLRQERFLALERALKKQHFAAKDADLFSFKQTADLHTIQDKTIQSFLALLASKEFHTYLRAITHKETKGRVDASGFLYTKSDYLLCHDDGVSSRKVAYVMNFSTMQKKNGGAYCLFSSNAKNQPLRIVKRIFPQKNTLLLFNVTRRSHHQVEEVLRGKRYTISGWFHA